MFPYLKMADTPCTTSEINLHIARRRLGVSIGRGFCGVIAVSSLKTQHIKNMDYDSIPPP